MASCFLVFFLGIGIFSVEGATMSYTITTLWDSTPVPSADNVKITFITSHTVVEAFFLNDHEQYLEVELAPHGEFLVLMLNGRKNATKIGLPILLKTHRHDHSWTGEALIPSDYFPPHVTKFNAYAIHGTSSSRKYLSLYPVPHSKFSNPDFHRLEYFHPIDFSKLVPRNANSEPSYLWKPYTQTVG